MSTLFRWGWDFGSAPETVVSRNCGIVATSISGTRDRKVSRARAIISYLAAKEAGYTQTQIADYLNISRIGVRNSILRGQKMILCRLPC